MARDKAPSVKPKPKPKQTTDKSAKPRLNNAERSAYFARREAAKVLHTVLQGDANRQAVASIKSLVYSPSIRNKKATFALVCQTLKHLIIIKDVLEIANILNSKWKRQEELIYIIAYDVLFGKEISLVGGDAEKFLACRKDAMQSALAKLVVRKKAKNIDDFIALYQPPDITKPCYVRVNTLKLDVDSALHELGKQFKVQKDDMIPHLLVLPPHTDLHNHSLVLNGSIFVQVLDACSAPGNKTVHLAAYEGSIYLAYHVLLLTSNTLPQVSAILLDPSCSGSGTAAQRLDHLLPSRTTDVVDTERLNKLAAFQKKALAHALSSEHLLRTDPVEDKEGFFIALFVKKGSEKNSEERSGSRKLAGSLSNGKGRLKRFCHVNKKNLALPVFYRGIFKPWLHTKSSLTRKTYNSSN